MLCRFGDSEICLNFRKRAGPLRDGSERVFVTIFLLSSFEELLELDKLFKMHHRNIQSPAIELFTIKNNPSVTIMNDIFQQRAVNYNLRSQIDFTRSNVNPEHFGISSLRYLAAKVWDTVPNNMKNVNDIETSKNNITK